MFSVGTAACAFAPNIWMLIVFRIFVSLGIGGEWSAGANLVAESVPEHRRVEGLFLTFVFVSDLQNDGAHSGCNSLHCGTVWHVLGELDHSHR